jgi:hypothetical protein
MAVAVVASRWRARQACADVDGSEETEVADLDEAGGEDVVEKAADEFDGRAGRVGAPAGTKADGGVVEVDGGSRWRRDGCSGRDSETP